MKPILVSGIQPSGELHIGNYMGALHNFVKLQDKYNSLYFIADLHSMTVDYDPKKKRAEILNILADYIAAGIDPEKSVIFQQSDILEHTLLSWIFNTITPISFLERMTQYKEKSLRHQDNINAGLFDYPVLMAADILIYKAKYVPVGEDQRQHLELTRDIASWFNKKYGRTFTMPKAVMSSSMRVKSLQDPEKKMSKSAPNSYISISDVPGVVYKKMKSAVTDGGENPGSPAAKNFLLLLNFFGTSKDKRYFKKQYEGKSIRYGELKDVLAERISNCFKPFREKKEKLLNNEKYLKKVLSNGEKAVHPLAQGTIKEVKKKVGISL